MPEIRTQSLMTVLDDKRRPINFGAGVDERGRVVLIVPGCEPIRMAVVQATEFVALFRGMIREAAQGQRD